MAARRREQRYGGCATEAHADGGDCNHHNAERITVRLRRFSAWLKPGRVGCSGESGRATAGCGLAESRMGNQHGYAFQAAKLLLMWVSTALILTSMTLGVLGVVFDGRDTESRRLNTAGICMIVGIVVAALLGIAQQRADAASKSLEAAQAKGLAEKQLASMGEALRNIERGLQPLLNELVVTVQYTIPCAALSKESAAELCSKLSWTSLADASTKTQKELEDRFVPQFELSLFASEGRVEFHNGERVIALPDLTAVRRSGRSYETIETQSYGDVLRIKINRATLETRYSTGELVSAKDLDDVTFGVKLPTLYHDKVIALEVTTRTGSVFRSSGATKIYWRNGWWVGKLVAFQIDSGL